MSRGTAVRFAVPLTHRGLVHSYSAPITSPKFFLTLAVTLPITFADTKVTSAMQHLRQQKSQAHVNLALHPGKYRAADLH